VYGQVCSAKSSAQLAPETRKQLDGSGRRFFRKHREMPVDDHVANNIGRMSTFGFPIHVHPRDPNTIWTLPLNGDMAGRFPPDAAAAVWRSRDGGQSWQAMRQGLPQEGCFFTVLRQAMAGDERDPAGIYFGTNSGSVFASFDEGESWQEIARHLPTILAVEVLERR
jgi:hypothetical protein